VLAPQVISGSAVSAGPALHTTVTATATCPSGTAVVGGGAEVTSSDTAAPGNVQVVATKPSGNAWLATGVISAPLGGTNKMTVTSWAVCAPTS